MTEMTFTAQNFEGPLDLLLHLIAKHKLNIIDIEISPLLTQYLAYMEQRKKEDLELDSSFIEMAARLIEIKTATLLPKHEDEAKELKSQLTAELMEYQACKMAAELLRSRFEEHLCFASSPMELSHDHTFTGRLPLALLLGVEGRKVKKKKVVNTTAITQIIQKHVVSIGSRIINLMRKLYIGGKIPYEEAYTDARSRSHLVATFLGILELVKSGRIRIEDEEILLMQKQKP